MKKTYKLISMLLTALMLLSSLTVLSTINSFAEDKAPETNTNAYPNNQEKQTGSIDYVTDIFATPDEKLESMRMAIEKDGYRLYVDDYSGEVACVNTVTGEKIFTNPYDVAASTGNEETKYEILSQIMVTFTDTAGQERIFRSYDEAALRGQISVEAIKGGIRVEYTIGREQNKILVPRLISMERFEDKILAPLLETFGDELYNPRTTNTDIFEVQKALSYYMLYSKEKLNISKTHRRNIENLYGAVNDNLINSDAQYARAIKLYPIIENMAVFVFDPSASESELNSCEAVITKYCPDYTYEELEYDHILTDYRSDSSNPPVFRMALEYRIEADGLSVRLPANGIRFNESLYTLSTIDVLPYMGAGNSGYTGYNFFPDGSGTLFDFEELNTTQTLAVLGKVYGTDFAYHNITGTYQKTIRYPVFGIVEDAKYYTYTEYNNATGELVAENTIAGVIVEAIRDASAGRDQKACLGQAANLDSIYGKTISSSNSIETVETEKRGFVAIIEEGDALASLSTYHAGSLSDYNTIKMQFTPRPKDTYNLSDSISVGTDTEWTVVSERKYVGNYKIKYILLSETEADSDVHTYDASWFGMAVAYRDYLTRNGVISKLTEEDVTEDIPLYIETFGAIETTEKILSIPVTVMAPLTTFDNVATMYEELAAQGMKNINFKLTGYANGGMYYTTPGKLKFEKAVGGKEGFQELLDKAADVNGADKNNNFGIFPDFDFAYNISTAMFDGYSPYNHAAKTIDGRYASKQVYSATQQKYMNYYEIAISPAYFHEFYEKLAENYQKFNNLTGISVSTLGNALNSDFDEDEPYNREDSKEFTIEAFKHFDENYNQVMTDGGNAYVWKYVDHMLNVSLDSSRYNFSSCAVPFIGVVLHGSIKFAGEPLNMEGDIQYAILKAIENGASPYFILSYQNTQAFKKDVQLSKYYSIRYDIWSQDIVEVYDILNNVLSDVQDKYITKYESLGGSRVPDYDELEADILAEYNARLEAERNAADLLAKEIALAASIARENGRVAEAVAAEVALKAIDLYTTQLELLNAATIFDEDYYENVAEAYRKYRAAIVYEDYKNSNDPDEQALYQQYLKINEIYQLVLSFNKPFDECLASYDSVTAKVGQYSQFDIYRTYKLDIYLIYDNYGSGKILKAQIASAISTYAVKKELDLAIADYVEGNMSLEDLYEYIDKYGVSKIDTSDFEDAISEYVAGTLADTKFEDLVDSLGSALSAKKSAESKKNKALSAYEAASETDEDYAKKKADYEAKLAEYEAKLADYEALQTEFDAAVTGYIDGTLARKTLDAVIDEWLGTSDIDKAALDAVIQSYKAGEIKASALDEAIAGYSMSKLDKTKILAAVDEYDTAVAAYEAAKNGFNKGDTTEDEYNAAKAVYDKAVSAFKESADKYKNGDETKAKFYTNNKSAMNTFIAAQKVFAPVEDDYLAIKIDEAAYEKAVEDFEASEDQFNAAAAGFIVENINEADLAAADEKYSNYVALYNQYQAAANALKAVKATGFALDYDECFRIYLALEEASRYKLYGNVAAQTDAASDDVANYQAYLEAVKAVESLEIQVESYNVKGGSLDNYTQALAQLDVMQEPEFYKPNDATWKAEYDRAVVLANQSRMSAVRNLADVDGQTLVELVETLALVEEHLVLANKAVQTLADAEGVTLKYADGMDKMPINITNYDEIAAKSFIVKQAIDRAISVYNYIEKGSYEVVVDGRESEYTLNGHKLRYTRNELGEVIYFYGTYEQGYSYFTYDKDSETFAVYMKPNSEKTKSVGVTGLAIYECKENGKTIYYTASLEEGYTYYSKDDNGAYSLADPTVYSGVQVAVLDDGTVIYQDNETLGLTVYYSENKDADGNVVSYTRYEYYKSIRECAEEALLTKTYVKETIIPAVCQASSDKKLATDVQNRIDRNFAMLNKGDKVEEEKEEDFRYTAEDVVAVTYGNADGSAYKTILLNYNNYTVRVEYEGFEYTIPAYEYVVIERK